jgi:hypothetical protein
MTEAERRVVEDHVLELGGQHPRKLTTCIDSSAAKIQGFLHSIGSPSAMFDNLRCVELSIVEDVNANIIAIGISTGEWANERFVGEFDRNLDRFGHRPWRRSSNRRIHNIASASGGFPVYFGSCSFS